MKHIERIRLIFPLKQNTFCRADIFTFKELPGHLLIIGYPPISNQAVGIQNGSFEREWFFMARQVYTRNYIRVLKVASTIILIEHLIKKSPTYYKI